MSKKEADQLNKQENTPSEETMEEMTVTLDLDDGTSVNCAIVTILNVRDQDYIVLLPLEEDGENQDVNTNLYVPLEIIKEPTPSSSMK